MYSAIVLAAGIGSRMGLGYNKMLHQIKGQPVVVHTIKKFLNDKILLKQKTLHFLERLNF